MFDVGRYVETIFSALLSRVSFKPADLHSLQKLKNQRKISSYFYSRAPIRGKLIAVNSLNQMPKGS